MKPSLLSRGSTTIATLLLAFGLAISNAAAELKVGTVNMTTLLNNYHKTKAAEEEDKVNRTEIKKSDGKRTSAIKAIMEELRKFQAEFNDPSLSAEKRKSIAAAANEKQETLAVLQREREEFLERSSQALNQKMVGLMDDIRADVIAAVNAYAATAEVDYVFDESGLTTSQVPFLLYVRNRIDITADVLKSLNPEEAKAPEEGE